MVFAPGDMALFALAGLWAAYGIDGYRVTRRHGDPSGPSNPMLKTVARAAGAWMDNYQPLPGAMIVPAAGFCGRARLQFCGAARGGRCSPSAAVRWRRSASSARPGVAVSVSAAVLVDPDASLTVWDASSSRGTLITMTLVTVVFLPIILALYRLGLSRAARQGHGGA